MANLIHKVHAFLSTHRLKVKGSFYIIAAGIGGVLNLIVSIILGRALSLEEFALINLINGILIYTTTISGAFGTVVNYKSGYLAGKYNPSVAYGFWKIVRRKSFILTSIVTILWILMTPAIAQFFHIESYLPILLCTLILLPSFGYSADRGFLSSRLKFLHLTTLSLIEPLLKLLGAVSLIVIGFSNFSFTLAPIAFFLSFLLGWSFIKKPAVILKDRTAIHDKQVSFPTSLFLALLFSSTAQVILLSIDVILAKHYLPASQAGEYGLVSVITKILFFIGSLMSPLLAPFVSREEGKKKDTNHVLQKIFWGTFIMMVPFFFIFGIFSSFTAPILFGKKALLIYHYLPLTTFAISCFALGKIVSDYYVLKRFYIFPLIFFIVDLVLILFTFIVPINLTNFIYIMSSGWIVSSLIVIILHLVMHYIKISKKNILLAKIQIKGMYEK